MYYFDRKLCINPCALGAEHWTYYLLLHVLTHGNNHPKCFWKLLTFLTLACMEKKVNHPQKIGSGESVYAYLFLYLLACWSSQRPWFVLTTHQPRWWWDKGRYGSFVLVHMMVWKRLISLHWEQFYTWLLIQTCGSNQYIFNKISFFVAHPIGRSISLYRRSFAYPILWQTPLCSFSFSTSYSGMLHVPQWFSSGSTYQQQMHSRREWS